MNANPSLACEVAIVGLGPTGAVLANLLGQRGRSVICLERDEDIYYAPKAVHFDDEAMRIFQDAGLAEAIAASAESFEDMELLLKPGRAPVARLSVGNQDRRYGHAGAWWFHQPTLERQLREGLRRFPQVRTLLGWRVTALQSQAEGVSLQAENEAGATLRVAAQWLIGCDGGRSFVRRASGIELASADFDEAWVVVDTRTVTGRKNASLPKRHRQVCDPTQPVTYVPLAGPYYEWQFMVVDGADEKTATDPARVRRQLAPFVNPDQVEINRIAHYRFHALWARRWRAGRVLLAGDSAHQMPPFLGQGMCSGLRDAHALAWRLDLLLAGRADDQVLQDYEDERGQHVMEIIQGAMFLGRIIQTRSRLVAWLRNQFLLRPVGRVPLLNRWLMNTANRKRPITAGSFGRLRPALAGHLLPQPKVQAADGRQLLLDELLGPGFALLTLRGGSALDARALAELAQRLPLRVLPVGDPSEPGSIGDRSGTLQRLFRQHRLDFILVRPDRYIHDAGRSEDFVSLVASLGTRFMPDPHIPGKEFCSDYVEAA
ncbi:MAG: bifunctional 3-(3-hydroxy-phenyl)propionate/3-hydroxycinnamic acid hydroxylase [Paucibacter sp.]|nr:bifunctional 3-(3-hydroxy-phenyl)propionate/3-hydroxycinnamic acid hydroxylase [Roseateles sp.]